MKENRFKTYNRKCTFFSVRMRNGKDDKYIEFLKNCPDRMAFIREAIDKAIAET